VAWPPGAGVNVRTVFVVEDHADTRELYVEVVQAKGWHAVGLATLEEARERLLTTTAADVVVMDLSLAGVDAALARELRRTNCRATTDRGHRLLS
jgi:DNA-binding response OmpR family regulator